VAYTITRSIDNQLEHIRYTPACPRFETPILLQHGMYHFLTLTTTPSVRNPQRVGHAFLTEGAIYTPEALYAQVGSESLLVLL
jgi:hypothetical protein